MSKIKVLQRRATIAWSASSSLSDLIAAGTAAGTIDLDFDTTSTLEICSLNINNKDDDNRNRDNDSSGSDSSLSMSVVGKAPSVNRFHKIVWGQHTGNGERTHGIIAGGMDNGSVTLWDPAKIIAGKVDEANLGLAQKHTGAVQALDFNPYQHNLLASGATDSEIFIWDLSNPSNPTVYSPGTKPQQSSDVSCVAWNKKVPHMGHIFGICCAFDLSYILASSSHTGITSIWDLKAKRSIFNFTDQAKSQVRAIAWNPQEATQVLTASEDDSSPLLYLWDLRNIYTPIRKFIGHTRGIWGVSWCPFDNSLIVSCGKDNRTLCWHTESAEMLCEVEVGNDPNVWNADVQWSPRTPAVLSTSSLDGKVSVYALQDVCERNVAPPTNEWGIAAQPTTRSPLSHTPSWLRRPVGVVFGFGGSLATFSYNSTTKKSTVKVRKIITEKELLDRSERLEEVVGSGTFEAFCDEKITSSSHLEGEEQHTWKFLKVLFNKEGRHKILEYLGFDEAQTAKEIQDIKLTLPSADTEEEKEVDTQEKAEIEPKHEEATEASAEQGDGVAGLFGSGGESSFPSFSFQLPVTPHEAVSEERKGNVASSSRRHLARPIQLATNVPGPENAITKALLIGNFEAAVGLCVKLGRMADALVLAACGGEALWAETQDIYFASQKAPYTRVMASIVRNDLRELVEQADLSDWKAILAILCTYAKSSELPKFSTILGDRLDLEARNVKAATLCYICAGSIEKTVNVWIRTTRDHKDPHQALQDLIEKVSIFRHAVNASDNDLDELLTRKYTQYAEILASQGRLPAALRYLSFLTDAKYSHTSGAVLLDRVFHSYRPSDGNPPPFPFKRQTVGVFNIPAEYILTSIPNLVAVQAPAPPTQHQQAFVQPPASVGFTHIPPASPFPGPSHIPTPVPPVSGSSVRDTTPPPVPTAGPAPPAGPSTGAFGVAPSQAAHHSHPIPPQPPSSFGGNIPPMPFPAKSEPPPFPHSLPLTKPQPSSQPQTQQHIPVSSEVVKPSTAPSNTNADVRYVIDTFNKALSSPNQREKAKWDDLTKRLPLFIVALEKGECKAEAVQLLVAICKATEAGDNASANKFLQDLTVSNQVQAKELIGVKRFVEVTKLR